MLFMVRPDTKSAHLLADLLETIEVTADELMDQRLGALDKAGPAEDGDTAVQNRLAALRKFVRLVRELELSLLGKLEQARVRASTVARGDWRLRPIMSMFTSGTQALADHIASPAGRAAMRFDGSNEVVPFLRSRELLAPMAKHYDGAAEILVTDSFRLLGLIKLSDLLQRCEVALNALDAHYDLYEWPAEDAPDAEEAAAVALVAAPVLEAAAEPEASVVMAAAPIAVVAEGPAPVAFEPAPAAEPATETEPTNWGTALAATAAPDMPAGAQEVAPAAPAVVVAPPAEPLAPEPQIAQQTAAAVSAAPEPELAATLAAAAEATPALPEPAPREPTAQEIAIAEAASEDGLKSLSERLWELKQADAAEQSPEPAKSDAA